MLGKRRRGQLGFDDFSDLQVLKFINPAKTPKLQVKQQFFSDIPCFRGNCSGRDDFALDHAIKHSMGCRGLSEHRDKFDNSEGDRPDYLSVQS